MARPRRSQQTREDLLREGSALLARQGYHGTGLQEILARSNAPKGSFYNHFESKEAFAAEIIDRYIDQLVSLTDKYLARAEDDPRTLIRNVYSRLSTEFARQGCVQGCLLGNLAAEIGASNPLCRASLHRAYELWQSRFVPLFEAGQRLGQFRHDIDAQTLASLFWNAWEGGITRMKVEGSTESLDTTLNLMLDQLMAPTASNGPLDAATAATRPASS
ncbi:TetR/AcrR family transcriptional regulator [Mangrovitalea sediminis]|uniref:TetR/AcrR family transcriptional regulator n=1 Tax=Mangrovitalea sediminis TaxID=1982043 RepID=UPI000BE5A5A2|nr:TetR/AcrR family transcriptional regulator [Mangrovitalea sediminis]